MSAAPRGLAVVLFTGGRGGASIAAGWLRRPGTRLTLAVNGYDNGLSTGALRRWLPRMLGPSDFRKNLLVHLDPRRRQQAALRAVLTHRLPAGATAGHLDRLAGAIAAGRDGPRGRFAGLPAPVRSAFAADLAAVRERLRRQRHGLDLADCALGNLVLAGAYLRHHGDFNAAVASVARTVALPARLLNVTGGENAFLVALKGDGRLLADEAEIVAPQDPCAITDLFLLRAPVDQRQRAELSGLPVESVRKVLAGQQAQVTLHSRLREAVREADLIVYGPGTPHSSLLPSFLTPELAEAIAQSRARAKVFVVNLGPDHDVQGLGEEDLVRLTLTYLSDPDNHRRTVTHVLRHGPGTAPGWTGSRRRYPAGARWVTADLRDPARPGVHHGDRTVAALREIAGEAARRSGRPARAGTGLARLAAAVAGRRVWLCDLDGTLVDSAGAHEAAFRDAIGEVAPSRLDRFRYLPGASSRDVVAGLGLDAATANRLVRRKQQLYRGYADAGRVPVFPGAHRLLDHLARCGHTVYLVTSGSRGSVERVLAACALRGRFGGVLTGDDVAAGKPDPAPYREACRRFGVDPADAVAVEDSAYGVAAALGAGLVTVQVHARTPAPGAVPARHLAELVSALERGRG